MINTALIISIISAFGAITSIFFAFKNNKRTDTKEIEERVRSNTEINFKLNNILSTTGEIRDEMTTIRSDVKEHGEQIIRLEGRLSILENKYEN